MSRLRHRPARSADHDESGLAAAGAGETGVDRRADAGEAPAPSRVELRGRFLVTEPALAETERLLRSFRDVDGDHEGLVFLCGREIGDTAVLCTAVAPACEHGPGRVLAARDAVHDLVETARRLRLGVLVQVHSHPGAWTRHSQGDDHMVLMPYEGMLSIVIPHYGASGLRPLSTLGVHQFQDGRWRLATEDSIGRAFTLIPAGIDLR